MKGAGSALHGSLPRRYARALIQIAQEEGGAGQVEAFGRALEETRNVLEHSVSGPTFLKVLADDTLDADERLAAVAEIADQMGVPVLFKNFLLLLVRKERIGLLPQIAREYQRFQDEILGIVRVEVVTPTSPEGGMLERVGAVLSQKLRKKILTRGEADPDLIGGLVLRVDHVVYDGSIRRELEKIKENILRS